MARASALQAEGQGFESPCLQSDLKTVDFLTLLAKGTIKQYGQANKGPRRMPRSCQAKKDVISCEKPGGGANIP